MTPETVSVPVVREDQEGSYIPEQPSLYAYNPFRGLVAGTGTACVVY